MIIWVLAQLSAYWQHLDCIKLICIQESILTSCVRCKIYRQTLMIQKQIIHSLMLEMLLEIQELPHFHCPRSYSLSITSNLLYSNAPTAMALMASVGSSCLCTTASKRPNDSDVLLLHSALLRHTVNAHSSLQFSGHCVAP